MKRPLVADPEEFLKLEYANAYSRVFKTFDLFREAMQPYLQQCPHCKACYWLDGDKRCHCHLNTNNHGKDG